MNCWEIPMGQSAAKPYKREGSTTNSILYNNSSLIEERNEKDFKKQIK